MGKPGSTKFNPVGRAQGRRPLLVRALSALGPETLDAEETPMEEMPKRSHKGRAMLVRAPSALGPETLDAEETPVEEMPKHSHEQHDEDMTAMMKAQARENITLFQQFCRDCGVPENAMFTTDDLFLAKNIDQVINTIGVLGGRIQVTVPQFDGPKLGHPINAEVKDEKRSSTIGRLSDGSLLAWQVKACQAWQVKACQKR